MPDANYNASPTALAISDEAKLHSTTLAYHGRALLKPGPILANQSQVILLGRFLSANQQRYFLIDDCKPRFNRLSIFKVGRTRRAKPINKKWKSNRVMTPDLTRLWGDWMNYRNVRFRGRSMVKLQKPIANAHPDFSSAPPSTPAAIVLFSIWHSFSGQAVRRLKPS